MENGMNDDLVYKIFVELAVLEGKREVNGQWKINDPQELSRLFRRSVEIIARASTPNTVQQIQGTQRPHSD